MTATLEAEAPEKTALYRVWGDADLLLYIGVSKDFGARWKQHAKQQPWWDEMRRLAADGWFDFRSEAEAAEEAAIKVEKPKYNIVHNGAVRADRAELKAVAAAPTIRVPRTPEEDSASAQALLDRVMQIGPKTPGLISAPEILLSDPAWAEGVISRLPEERRDSARAYLDAWRENDRFCRVEAPRILAEYARLEQMESMAGHLPEIRKAKADLCRLAFGWACRCCDDEPPAGMTCSECGLAGPDLAPQRRRREIARADAHGSAA